MKIERTLKFWILTVCGIVLAILAPAWAASAPFEARCDNGRLSVTADGAPLAKVLKAVASSCDLEARGIGGLDRPVQAKFSGLPLRDGITKLMGKINYALLEASTTQRGHLVLMVFDRSSGSMTQAAAEKSGKGAKPKKPNPDEETIRRVTRLQESAKNGQEEAVRKAATDSDPAVQAVALELLAKQDPGKATDIAVNCVHSEDPNQRITGVQTLADIDDPKSASALGSVLKDNNTGVRESAVAALGSQTGSEAIGYLTQATQDPDPNIETMALDFLSQRGREGEDAIRKALFSQDPQVRAHARQLLSQMAEE